jgi:hypothetical protein
VTRPQRRKAPEDFGCPRCYGDDAEHAWAYYEDGLVVERELVGEPHFIVQLRRCAGCGQQFVWVFSESVDWEGGEDAQRRSIVPLADGEAESLDVRSLAALGDGRRYLETWWPTATREQKVDWATGMLPLRL